MLVFLSIFFSFFLQETIAPILSEYTHHTRDIPCFSIGVQLQMRELTVDRRFFFSIAPSLVLSFSARFSIARTTKHINMFILDRTLGRFTFARCYVISLDKNQSVVLFLTLSKPCLLQSFRKLLVPLCCVLSLAQCECAHRIGVLFKLFSAIRFLIRERNAYGSRIVTGFNTFFFSSVFLFSNIEKQRRERKRNRFFFWS